MQAWPEVPAGLPPALRPWANLGFLTCQWGDSPGCVRSQGSPGAAGEPWDATQCWAVSLQTLTGPLLSRPIRVLPCTCSGIGRGQGSQNWSCRPSCFSGILPHHLGGSVDAQFLCLALPWSQGWVREKQGTCWAPVPGAARDLAALSRLSGWGLQGHQRPPQQPYLVSQLKCLSTWKSELSGAGRGQWGGRGRGVCLFKCTLCQRDKEFDGFIRNTKALFSRVRLTPLSSTQSADKLLKRKGKSPNNSAARQCAREGRE